MSVAEEVRERLLAMKRRVEAVRRIREGSNGERLKKPRSRGHWWERDSF